MAIVSSGWGFSDEREPSAAELAAIEGAALSASDQWRVRRYWQDVIQEAYQSVAADLAAVSVGLAVAPVEHRKSRRAARRRLAAVVSALPATQAAVEFSAEEDAA